MKSFCLSVFLYFNMFMLGSIAGIILFVELALRASPT
jgi:hypothetical protein